jgi:hypothetical protein
MFDGIDRAIQVLFVAPADLLVWAERIRPHIAKMAEGSDELFETSDLFAALASGRMLLWVALEGAALRCVMVGEIVIYPRARVLRITGLVGNHPWRWRGLLPVVEAQARDQFGCTRIQSLHQPRHIAFLPGFKTGHWLSEKML